jgi:ankyrin repeat protein
MSHFDPVPEHLLASNQESTKENVSLFKSALAGSLFGVRHALEQGAKPNYFYNPEDSKNALHVAAEHGHEEIVVELLTHGAVVDSHVVGSKETALLLALCNQHNKICRILIDAGANINAGIYILIK